MADGSAKPIEDVQTGDLVLATDPETGRTEAKPVTHLIEGQGEKDLVGITIDVDGDKGDRTAPITATDKHPFWVEALGRWLDAEDLEPGMWLRTSAGTQVEVTAVTAERAPQQRVHNLTVADLHTYYVLAGGTPVLVHNSNCDLPEGYTEAPALKGDPQHPDSVATRSAENNKFYKTPEEVHTTVNAIESGGISQRISGGAPDVFRARQGDLGNNIALQKKWNGSTVYTGVGKLTGGGAREARSDTRVLVSSQGRVGYVLNHKYEKVLEYDWAWLKNAYVP